MPSLLVASTVPAFIRAFLIPYAQHFRAQGWRVDAIANGITSDKECSSAFDRVWDVNWSRNPLDPLNFVQAPAAVRRIVADGAYDIVHVHTPVAGTVCRYALRKRPGPVRIYTAHGFHFHEEGSRIKSAVFAAVEKLAGRWTDYLVVINRFDENAARQKELIDPSRLFFMPGIGVDTERKYNPRSITMREVNACRESIRLAPEDRMVLMVAEFIPRKRHIDALHAFQRLKDRNAMLVFAGAGPTMPAMQRLSKQLGLEGRVRFLGFRRDIAVLMKAAQILLLCSIQEGLPRSIMEALSLEVPVVASDIRGNRELLEGGAGYLYPVGDIETMAQILEDALGNPAKALSRAKIGRERMAKNDLRRIIAQHEQLYAEALQDSHRLVAASAAC
jgi:glycosyltransferase involved in cell wall biosynthesis